MKGNHLTAHMGVLIVVLASSIVTGSLCFAEESENDPLAAYVWPQPPDTPQIKLKAILSSRLDVEAESKLKKALIGAGDQSPYDHLVKPFAVAIDAQGRVLVTDPALGAVVRFDRSGRRYDVFGTKGPSKLAVPLGLDLAEDGRIFVTSSEKSQVVAYDPEGKVVAVYGRGGALNNPSDVTVSPDGKSLFVADSKEHRIVVFDIETTERKYAFGSRGEGEGEFAFPSSLAFDPEGNLLVVDQINSRVQLLTADGRYLDELGSLGMGYGNFVRPKGVAVDSHGLIYVTDAAFSNLQLFDVDFQLLTFIGAAGRGPGEFSAPTGVAVRGDLFAVVDQLNRRIQLFEYINPRIGE